jgi:hypothetical protein
MIALDVPYKSISHFHFIKLNLQQHIYQLYFQAPSTTSTTPRTSPFPNPRRPLISVSSRSRRIRKLLPQLCVCVSHLVTMVCIWCTRSLGRFNFLDLLLRHNALVGGHPGPRKKSRRTFFYSLTRRSRVQVLPTRARNNDTWDRRRIVNNMR